MLDDIMTMRTDPMDDVALAYDGPIPPAELLSVQWGRGAFARIARAADAAGAEACVRKALSALRRAAECGTIVATLRRIERFVVDCRKRALAAL